MKSFNYWLSAYVIFGVLWLLRRLPAKAAMDFTDAAARKIGPLMGRHRVAMNNLRKAYPEKSEEELQEIARDMWGNMARLTAEYVFLDAIFDYDPHSDKTGLIEVQGREIFERLLDEKDRPHIFFTGHTGNFELLPICAATFDLNVTALFRPPNNPYRRQKNPGCAPHQYGASRSIEGRRRVVARHRAQQQWQCRHAGRSEIPSRHSFDLLQSPMQDQSAAGEAGTAI